jgi:hypothetical protein
MTRKRWIYFILIILTIPAGLATRFTHYRLPYLISTYGGDVLSATCIFWGVRFVATKTSLLKVAVYSYLICIAIETSQLCQAAWLNNIRHTFPFGILLGYGFLWSDWVCYAVGVLIALVIAYTIETAVAKKV